MSTFGYPLFSSFSESTRGIASVAGKVRFNPKKDASKPLAGFLLAAVLSILVVAADQLVDTWTDGHLLAGWVALWVIAFSAMALLAPRLRKAASQVAAYMAQRAHAAKQEQIEEQMWEFAHHDPRVMEELQQAWIRSQEKI